MRASECEERAYVNIELVKLILLRNKNGSVRAFDDDGGGCGAGDSGVMTVMSVVVMVVLWEIQCHLDHLMFSEKCRGRWQRAYNAMTSAPHEAKM